MSMRISPVKFVLSFLAVTTFFASGAFAQGVCTINVFVENVGEHRIWIRNEFVAGKGTAVRATAGGWRALSIGNWKPTGTPDSRGGPYFGLNKGERVGDGYDAALACNVRRQFQFEYTCADGPNKDARFVKYHPSIDSWTPQRGTDIVNVQLGAKCN